MRSLKTLLVLLLTWTFCAPALASTSAGQCRHAGGAGAEVSHSGHAMPPQAVDPHAMHHGHGEHSLADGSAAQKASLVSLLGCGGDCHCVDQHCASSVPGPASQTATGFATVAAVSLRPARQQASPACAYTRDLIRPPSIS
jgi:hypothetical protein